MYDAASRNLLWQLTLSQYKLKDQSSFFGLLWSFLHPLLLLFVLYGFFRARLGMQIENYPVYLLLGLVLYTHFGNCTSLAMRVLKATRQLTTDTIFRKELLVFSAVLSSSVELVVSLVICTVLALATGAPLSAALAWAPVIFAAELVLVLWVSLLLAALYPFAWDIDHIFQVFLRALFFLTPIFYEPSFVGEGAARSLITLNPLAYVIEFSRAVIMQGESPQLFWLGGFFILNAGLVGVTLVLFRYLEPRFAEHV